MPSAIAGRFGAVPHPGRESIEERPLHRGIELRPGARRQRFIIWRILFILFLNCIVPIGMGASALPLSPREAINHAIVVLILCVCPMLGTVARTAALKPSLIARMICVPQILLPFFKLIILLFVNSHTDKTLRRAGIRVGRTGVADETMRRRLFENR